MIQRGEFRMMLDTLFHSVRWLTAEAGKGQLPSALSAPLPLLPAAASSGFIMASSRFRQDIPAAISGSERPTHPADQAGVNCGTLRAFPWVPMLVPLPNNTL